MLSNHVAILTLTCTVKMYDIMQICSISFSVGEGCLAHHLPLLFFIKE